MLHALVRDLHDQFCNLWIAPNNQHSLDQEKKRYIGTRLASGQDILCQQLILGPSYKIPSLDMPSDASDSNLTRKVARGVCIISSSIKEASSNVLVVFPPKCEDSYFSSVNVCIAWISDLLLICFLHFSITRAASYSCSGASAEQQCSSMPSWNVSYVCSVSVYFSASDIGTTAFEIVTI